ncbi:MAG: DNA-directed RNA polymerase subunit omega [Bacteroidaceae bacterium]|nr:DNA-directed RNA polymerase subunit omega [Bacteroidaceae bacterium]
MDYKNVNAPLSTVTRNLIDISRETGNVYESVAIIAKRSNQVAADMKEELNKKLQEFGSTTDTLEEEFHNDEQITVSKHYERMPKPTLIATQEFLEDKLYYRNPAKDTNDEF